MSETAVCQWCLEPVTWRHAPDDVAWPAFVHRTNRTACADTSPRAPYQLECFGCGIVATNEYFGLGRARQCRRCGSYEIHSPEAR